jgi:hypothetical protein
VSVRAHYEAFFAGRENVELVWNRGPMRELLPDFRVLRFEPGAGDGAWVYATAGGVAGKEFVLGAPEPDAAHVELVTMVAHMHADPDQRLHEGKVLEIGRPWLEGSRADHVLVSLPYPWGPSLERCGEIQILWLLPVTASEAAFAREHGHLALEERLEAAGAQWLRARRRPVA